MHPSASPERLSPWQGITEPTPVGLGLLLSQPDAPPRFLHVSPSCLALVNVELEVLQADPALALQVVHPDDRDSFEQRSAARAAAGEPFHWRGRLLVNGAVSWVRINSWPTPQADGSLLWECVLFEFGGLNKREQELQQRLQDLHRSLDHLPIPVAIGRIDPDPAVLLVNRCFSETFGYDLGSIGSLAGWMEKAYPDARQRRFSQARWQADLTEARRGAGPIPARRDRLTCRDGSRRDVWIRAVVVDDLLLATFLDITERRRAELTQAQARRRQGRQQRQELDRKLQSSLTAAAMVHEIQQPLSTLLIGAQLALSSLEERPGPASPQLRTLLATQLDQARQLQQTAERMRALLRNVQTPHLPVNLNEVAESALLFLRRTLLDAGIRVDLQAASPSGWVAGDGPQLQIAVINLLRNAQQALLAAAAAQPRIVLALWRNGEVLQLTVEDNGPGLPPELIAGGVVTSAQARRLGLGLYVVHTTMENHGGTLRLGRSRLGGGRGDPALSGPALLPPGCMPPMRARARPEAALAAGRWVKWIAGASNQDVAAIEDLAGIYALAGVHCLDLAADAAVVAAARRGVAWALARGAAPPWLMVSLSDGQDPHFRKAWFDPRRCPPQCPRPCERVCPAQAIGEAATGQAGVLEERCYGCGRCTPACPLGLIEERDHVLAPAAVPPLLRQLAADAVELHTQPGRQQAFEERLRQLAASGVPLRRVAVSAGADVPPAELWERFAALRRSGFRPLWQLDGRPMSGDVGDGTARAAVALLARRHQAMPPGPLQLAGGTNRRSLPLLASERSAARCCAGVAFGGVARRQLQPLLLQAQKRGKALLQDGDLWPQALALARQLVGPWLERF